MIINIRGTNGSGKSSTVRNVMLKMGGFEKYYDTFNKHVGYVNHSQLIYVVGRYETPTGGCDAIKTQDEICAQVRVWAIQRYSVIFEGVIVSTLFQRYCDLADDLRSLGTTTFYYMDTPLEQCFRNLELRQNMRFLETGKRAKPIKHELVAEKVRSIASTRRKFDESGHCTRNLSFGHSHTQIIEALDSRRVFSR